MTGDEQPLRLGISSCLLGENVRWDGGHKRLDYVTDVLASRVVLVPTCPEVEIGLGVPREPIRLERADDGVRLRAVNTGADLTERMTSWTATRIAMLDELDGYVLKARSPSCGLRVDVLDGDPRAGTFADALTSARPDLPVVEETGLRDDGDRRHFLERAFAFRRARRLFAGDWTLEDLVEFHERHELQVVAHSTDARNVLARIVTRAATTPRDETAIAYRTELSRALAPRPTARRHFGVLRRAWNRLEGRVAEGERAELEAAIRDYGQGRGVLDDARRSVAEAASRVSDGLLARQTYLDPESLGQAPVRAVEGSGPRDAP